MNSPASASDSAYQQLHPALQRWIWQQGWPSLRPIQAEAVPLVLAREHDVVISAPTAGGKTEAAFLPILTDIASHPSGTLRCLAVAPLRALITDQAGRLESLCDAVGLRIQPWHGDISKGKQGFWKRPAEVLMTTPESLEAMLMRRGPELATLAPGLRYLVIDELHSFIGSERGAQLASLLQRVESLAGKVIPRIALSATLGDLAVAKRFLRPDGALPCTVLTSDGHAGELRLQLRAVYQPRACDGSAEEDASITPVMRSQLEALPMAEQHGALPVPPGPEDPLDSEDTPGNRYLTALSAVTAHLFERLRGGCHLVFANSRNQVETIADILRDRCESMGLPNEFFAHHGALSKDLRTFVEERLRQGSPPTTAVCTSTLEMGIDLGDVDTVGQIGPPPSVSSLKQRVGRSGRRAGQAQTLRQYVVLPAIDATSHALDWLRLPLIQSIASIELMLEGSFEPPASGELHLSTLTQQLLSVIVQRAGVKVPAAFGELIERGAFTSVPKALFLDVLRALHASEAIEQAKDGSLLLGARGEHITNHYSFYAAFNTPEEFVLMGDGRRLGTLPINEPLVVGQLLVFGGRRWRVVSIAERERIISVVPSQGGQAPRFSGSAIGQHRSVHERMRTVLAGDVVPRYLDPVATQALADARAAYRWLCLDQRRCLPDGAGACVAHWAGSHAGGTLVLILQAAGHTAALEGPFLSLDNVAFGAVPGVFVRLLRDWPQDAVELAKTLPVLVEDKFDSLLSRDVLAQGYAARHIDLAGARVIAEALSREPVVGPASAG